VDALPLGCDNAPAFVPLHGVGHGADANCQVGIGAVPGFQYAPVLTAPADRLSGSGHLRTYKINEFEEPSTPARRPTSPRHCRWLPRAFFAGLPRWVHKAPPTRAASSRMWEATAQRARVPPVDYLDNPRPPQMLGPIDMPPKKCGFRPAPTRLRTFFLWKLFGCI
jgi:hypothetical protein